jgi:hypothetical protein
MHRALARNNRTRLRASRMGQAQERVLPQFFFSFLPFLFLFLFILLKFNNFEFEQNMIFLTNLNLEHEQISNMNNFRI